MNDAPLNTAEKGGRPNTAELLARLPPILDIKRPFFWDSDDLADVENEGDVDDLKDLMSGHYLDFMLTELLESLPDVKQRVQRVGPAGLVLEARPSNTINALTVPTRDGAIIIYNLGLYSILYSVACALAVAVCKHAKRIEAGVWLCGLVDWATSRAMEPRYNTIFGELQLDDEDKHLAVKTAAQAHRFAMCHELAHVLAYESAEEPVRSATVGDVVVSALRDTWEKEYAADRDGLAMFIRALASQGKSASGALIGAELFLNAAGMLQESSADEHDAHPPPDDRLARVRSQFFETFGEQGLEFAGPSLAVRHHLEAYRKAVTLEVRRRRAETRRDLDEIFESYPADVHSMTRDEKLAAAKRVSRLLLKSPGATLDYLRERIFAPKGNDEPDGGSSTRMLAINAALQFKKPLQEAVELPRLQSRLVSDSA